MKVVQDAADAGYEAYIVGGAVRDLLVGLRPKDFDVATNATPEQVKGLFRRAFIVGRRFRLVHVIYGRGREHPERSRCPPSAPTSTTPPTPPSRATRRPRAASSTARATRGRQRPRAARQRLGPADRGRRAARLHRQRDVLRPETQIVVDYHGGMADSKAKLLRMIGDPETRYREDPVRIIRVLRFAAKMGYKIEAKTEAPIRKMKALLANVPASRMFDEMIKLLQTGRRI